MSDTPAPNKDPRAVRQKLIDELRHSRAKMRDLLALVNDDQEIYPTWTIKQVLAHITGWDEAVTASLRAHSNGQEPGTPAYLGINKYNQQSVDERAGLNYRQIYTEWEQTRETLYDVLEATPDTLILSKLIVPWGATASLTRMVGTLSEHELEHAVEIRQLLAENQANPGSVDRESFKKRAGAYAAALVETGMLVGLGTGSTALHMVRALGDALKEGRLSNIQGVATSAGTAQLARDLGIPLLDPSQVHTKLDLAIDGADEIDPAYNLIKGGGGALLREKLIAERAARFVVMGDTSKRVAKLGLSFQLPLEVLPFAWEWTADQILQATRAVSTLRQSAEGAPYRTDNGNVILDCHFSEGIADPAALAATLKGLTGVVEHGLFVDLASEVILAGPSGLEHIKI
jgi:ribose 5-phosphate isomerase A